MTDGVILGADGKAQARVYGFAGAAPAGCTFLEMEPSLAVLGQEPPSVLHRSIPATDTSMARVTEDLLAALIAKGTIAAADIPAAALAHINARRAIRGLASL